jgi:hypothetical protein
MTKRKTQIEMIDFYHGQFNGSVRWHKGEMHKVDAEAAKSLVERGYAKRVRVTKPPDKTEPPDDETIANE